MGVSAHAICCNFTNTETLQNAYRRHADRNIPKSSSGLSTHKKNAWMHLIPRESPTSEHA